MAKVITIAQQKGGAGKTTLASHVAVALSQMGNRVAVVDIDPQGSLGYWHRIREERFGEDFTGLHFSTLSGWRVGSEISRLRKVQDYIIIDSPPHTETEARTAIRCADLILIPMQPSPTDLWATKATLDLAKQERIPVKIVLNRVNTGTRLAGAIMDELGEEDVTDAQLSNRVLFASSLLEGRCATEVEPSSPAAKEVKRLIKEIKALMAEKETLAANQNELEGA